MIMRDVNNGWLIRYIHSNTASAFFFLVYLHIGRGLYYGSYQNPRTLVWSIGVVIFILMMATAFLGYKRSPKWSKFNNSGFNNNKLRVNSAQTFGRDRLTTKRYYSTAKNPPINNNSKILDDFIKEKKLRPIYCYEDLHLESTKKNIQTDTKNLSGVYLILNKVTLDYYIGSAATNRFYARFSNHLLNFHGSKIVKLAVRKYKLPQFALLILELFPEVVNKENNKKLLDLEDFYLKSLLPNYNILTEAGSSFGYKHTEITRIKMKSNYSIERREMIGSLNRGKNLSDETKEKMREKAMARETRSYIEQGTLNMKKKSKPIILYNMDYTEIKPNK